MGKKRGIAFQYLFSEIGSTLPRNSYKPWGASQLKSTEIWSNRDRQTSSYFCCNSYTFAPGLLHILWVSITIQNVFCYTKIIQNCAVSWNPRREGDWKLHWYPKLYNNVISKTMHNFSWLRSILVASKLLN